MVHAEPPPDEAKRRGRYRLIRRIGRGGMGEVWLAAIDNAHGVQSQFALKVLHPELLERGDHRALVVDEARIASRIQSPHTARVIELLDDEIGLCIVMEWIDGTPLSRILRDGPLPLGVALRIAADACAGLHAAHELTADDGTPLEVVHRDVSPPNLIVDRGGVTKVLDFGIAKARGRLARETTSGVKGRASYMSLEQAKAGAIDRRSDVFAIGIVLYEMLTGEHPFGATDDMGALVALSAKKPPLPMPKEIPAVVSALVKRALAHEPNKRFPTALSMRTEIEAAMIDCNVVTDAAEVARVVGSRPSVRRQRSIPPASESGLPPSTLSAPTRSEPPLPPPPAPQLPQPAPPVVVAAPATSKSRLPRVLFALALVLVIVGTALAIVLRRPTTEANARAPVASATVTPSVTAADTAPTVVVNEPGPVPLDIDSLPTPTATPRSSARAPSTASAASVRAALPSCDPPWYIDSAGHREYWKHCLRTP